MIGGYGGFGARLSRRLAGAGHQVLVGGRSMERATAFAAEIARAEGVRVDRSGDVATVLERVRPDLVIDAAGPFQGSSYRVPEACIAAAIPYLDLADARDFVCGVGSLDAAARTAGVAVVSGASSVPALSGAVARRLAKGLDRVGQVELAISASNQASAGAAVAAAMLSYVGQGVRLWGGGRWITRTGWQDQQRVDFTVAGASPIRGRLVALCDVPDHETLPPMLRGRPAVTFRAGSELKFQMRALGLLTWPVRWGWVRSMRGLAPWLRPLQRLTGWAGTDRSAMAVTLKGWRGEAPVARRWTLVAEAGDGPEIPTLAAALIAEEVLAGRIPAGARHAGESLELEQFAAPLGALNLRQEVVEPDAAVPLYARLMGERFATLPPPVRAIHLVHGDAGATGEGEVRRGSGLLARTVAWGMRFPPTGRYPLHVHFAEEAGVERWTRRFGPHQFSSELRDDRGLLTERFGPLRFRFALLGDAAGLKMVLRSWTCIGIPLPLALAPRIAAREWQEEDRFRLDVRIALPLVGDVVHYSGWLRPL